MPKLKLIRLTLEEAAMNFAVDRKTLSKYIKSGGVLPGADEKFSIMDIFSLLTGDVENAKLENIREDTEYKKVRKLTLANKLVVLDEVRNFTASWLLAAMQKIQNWEITDAQRSDMIKDLQDISVDQHFSESAPVPKIEDEE